MYWISFVGYTVFPLTGTGFQGTIQDVFHFYVVTISVVVLSIISLLMTFLGGLKSRILKLFSVIVLVIFLIILIGPIGIGIAPKEYFGLLERLSAFPIVILNGIMGLYGFIYLKDTGMIHE